MVHFYSGPPLHFLSGVDIRMFRNFTLPALGVASLCLRDGREVGSRGPRF